MKKIRIEGGHKLHGTIRISGAKNSAVALIPASLLSDEVVKINNIPEISDIDALHAILEHLGAKVSKEGNCIEIDASSVVNKEIPEEISSKLRASYYFMSSLLGKYKYVEMYFPGGCTIGARPIDQTLKGYRALGAKVVEEGNKYIISALELTGAEVCLDMPSVGATINIMLTAVKAKGETIIKNAAREPEIANLADFLKDMGAKISGVGTSTIHIMGVDYLSSGSIEVIPDRIEAGTYIIAGALMGDKLRIENIVLSHIESLISTLKKMGVPIEEENDALVVSATDKLKKVNVKTLGYPGFPTDLQQPITTLLTQCVGTSILEETIYENRFQNVPYLVKMGASITIDGKKIYIQGVSKLVGNDVSATDLRAGACLILAALKAEGETNIDNVEYVLRGYGNIIQKLTDVGAKISLEEI